METRADHAPRAVAIVAAAGLALLAGGCGSSGKAAGPSPSAARDVVKAASSAGAAASSTHLEDDYVRFAACMRSHGVGDFPDPIVGSGGHPGFSLEGGSSSDLNSSNLAFQSGARLCQHFLGHEFRFVFTPSGAGKGA
jgi:hypothetical protein